MAHSEKRSNSAIREAQLALFTGSIYGGTHTFTGHPLDTVKSKMQIESSYQNLNARQTIRKIFQTEGIRGFFRGVIPPLWGSMMYRGIMMSSYEAAFTYLDKTYDNDHILKKEVFFGLRPMVPVAIVFSSICRAFFESPIEYAKVMGQTNQKWVVKDIYRGVEFQIVRTTALLLPIFSVIDMFRRKTKVLDSLVGKYTVYTVCIISPC